MRVNVPLNDQLQAAPSEPADGLGIARTSFEDDWTRWNLATTVTNTAAFAALTVAL